MSSTGRKKIFTTGYGAIITGLFLLLTAFIVESFSISCAWAADEIKIGVIGPMKRMQGQHQWNGAELAANEINASGGIKFGGKSYKIKLVKSDSNSMTSVPDAISAMEKLLTVEKVNFVTGGFRSEAVLGQQDIIANKKIIFINVGSAAPELTGRIAQNYEKYKYFFRFGSINSYLQLPLHLNAIDMVAKDIRAKLGIKTPKVVWLAEKVMWADPIFGILKKQEKALGIEMVGEWRPSYTATDLSGELTQIKNAGAHIIYTGFTGPAGLTFSRQWGELQIPAAAIGVNMLAQELTHWNKTDGLTQYEAFWTTLARIKVSEKAIPFIDAYVKHYKEFPSVYAQTYDAIYLFKIAIEKAGTLNSDALVKVLEGTDYQGVSGRLAFYKPGEKWPHDMIWGPKFITNFFAQWMEGKQIAVWPPPGGEWEGVAYPGAKYYQLPPWMVKYWKEKK
jgi:branched-chain amino acid transport system substrate-binding protein